MRLDGPSQDPAKFALVRTKRNAKDAFPCLVFTATASVCTSPSGTP